MTMTLAALVENTLPSKALNGCFIPENNNQSFVDVAGMTSVSITDGNDKIVAFGAAKAMNAKLVYCSVNAVAPEFQDYTLWVEDVSDKEEKLTRKFKITESVPYPVKPNHQNQFETVFATTDGKPAFEHIFDNLVESTIGFKKLGTEKNITVDLHGETEEQMMKSVEEWVRIAGTIVSDRFSFYSCDINRYELLGLEDDSSNVKIEKVNEENLLDVLDYDCEVSIFDREKHISALIGTPGVFSFVARQNNQVTGYGVGMKNRILQCYGENEETVKQLLATLAAEIMSPEVTLCAREEGNAVLNELIKKATKTSRIVRLHSRSQPTGIKWSKIACPNMGLAIF